MAFTVYKNNTWDFSEMTEGAGGDTQPLMTNGEGRVLEPFEIVLDSVGPLYCGEVREADGIAIAGKGRINIEHRRVIRTAQIEVTDTFVVGAKVYFSPGGAGAAGKIVDAASKAAGDIEFGVCEGFGGVATAHTYIEVRPYAYDESRVLEV
jgi:hypothetical protein